MAPAFLCLPGPKRSERRRSARRIVSIAEPQGASVVWRKLKRRTRDVGGVMAQALLVLGDFGSAGGGRAEHVIRIVLPTAAG
jgi:hypothetical protein